MTSAAHTLGSSTWSELADAASSCATSGAADVDVLGKYDRLIATDYSRPARRLPRPLPQGVPVNDVLRYQMYAEHYGFEKEAMRLYARLDPARRADQCLESPAPCEGASDFGLPIRRKLFRAHAELAWG